MNRPLDINKRLSEVTKALLIIFPCVALAFPIKVASYHLGVVTAFWLYLSIREKSLLKFRTGNFFFLSLPFANYFILLLGMLMTSNFIMGSKTLETKIPLLILPMILFSGHDLIRNTKKKTILLTYSIGVLVICTYVIASILILSVEDEVGYSFRHLSGVIDIHPGYFSLYVGFAIIILIIQSTSSSNYGKVLLAIASVFLFIFNLLLVARMPIIALMVGIFIYLTIVRNFKIILLVLLIFATFLLLIGQQNPDWTHRILGPLGMLANGEFDQLQNFIYDRVQEFTCTVEILGKDMNLLTGFGTGDDNTALFNCYAEHGYDWILSQKYNAHNQYLQSVLQNGIVSGILTFLFIAAPVFSKSVTCGKSLEFIIFASMFGIFSLTESTLEVQKGVIFFSFFYSLLVYYADSEKGSDRL